MSTTGRISTSVSTSRVNSSSKLSMPVSQCSVPTFCRITRALLRVHRCGTMPLLPPVAILASDVAKWETMLTVVPREMARTLQASSTTVGRGKPRSSNNPGTTTRRRRATRVNRILSAGL
jgi:hypothetical protein